MAIRRAVHALNRHLRDDREMVHFTRTQQAALAGGSGATIYRPHAPLLAVKRVCTRPGRSEDTDGCHGEHRLW